MRFISQGKQLSIDSFRSSQDGLSKSNRWVELGDSLPWDEIERLCRTGMCYFVKNVMKFLKELLRALFLVMELKENTGNNWRRNLSEFKFAS